MSRRLARRWLVAVAAALLTTVAYACGQERDVLKMDEARMQTAPAALADTAQSSELAAAQSKDGAFGAVTARAALRGEAVASAASPPELAVPQALPGSMLVRVGQASIQVDSLEVGVARVREMARRTGAVIANTSMQGGREQVRSASLELRVPSERFEEAVNGLSPIGKLESVNVSVQDVGEEYVDIEARMANARRLEQRLVELLATRTGKLADVLSVEHELARVRGEIERYEGRLRYLRSRVSVSTLTLSVHEPFPIVAERPGTHPMRDAFVQAWRNLVGVTAAIIASLGVVLPLGLLALVLVLVARRVLPARVLRLTSPEPARPESA